MKIPRISHVCGIYLRSYYGRSSMIHIITNGTHLRKPAGFYEEPLDYAEPILRSVIKNNYQNEIQKHTFTNPI